MPLYEYECPKCGNQIEILQGVNDPDPECECGSSMKRVMSNTTFILKGNGWYATDYKNKKKEKGK